MKRLCSLGKGYVASDIKNVTLQLSDDAKAAFLVSYGEVKESEYMLHEVAGPLAALYFVSCCNIFPQWGYKELESVKNGFLLDCVNKLFIRE